MLFHLWSRRPGLVETAASLNLFVYPVFGGLASPPARKGLQKGGHEVLIENADGKRSMRCFHPASKCIANDNIYI